MEERAKPKRNGLHWRVEGDADLVLPILLAGWGMIILFMTETLLWLFVKNPHDPYDWGFRGTVLLGFVVGIWWTQSGTRQMYALWTGRRRPAGPERRYHI